MLVTTLVLRPALALAVTVSARAVRHSVAVRASIPTPAAATAGLVVTPALQARPAKAEVAFVIPEPPFVPGLA